MISSVLLKGIRVEKSNFSFLFNSLKDISGFTRNMTRSTYRLLKHNLPGPYTFILEASSEVPQIFRNRKKTIGIRIPDHAITSGIITYTGHPLIATSLHTNDEIADYPTDPNEIYEQFGIEADLIIDAGFGGNVPSTVIDCTGDEPLLVRKGAGDIEV